MFDAHTHLQDSRIAPVLSAVIAAAREAGITGLCSCGTSPSDWKATASVAAAAPLVVLPAFGVHPWFADGLPADWLDILRTYLDANPIAAIGEIGLDGIRSEIPLAAQEAVLHAQLEEAANRGIPVILHGARAWGNLVEKIEPYAKRIPTFVVHGFGGSLDLMKRLLAAGAYLSFGGTVCNPSAKKVHAAVALVPARQLLLETDSPDLFPVGGTPAGIGPNGKPLNQPSNLAVILSEAARLRGETITALTDLTSANARRAFLR